MDKRAPRDGRALEELGTYDPSIGDTDARVNLNRERIDYWLSVGAQPSEKVAVLLKKYGTGGTHLAAHTAALEKLAMGKEIRDPGAPASPATAAAGESADPPAAAEAPPVEKVDESKASEGSGDPPAAAEGPAPDAGGEDNASKPAGS